MFLLNVLLTIVVHQPPRSLRATPVRLGATNLHPSTAREVRKRNEKAYKVFVGLAIE